MSKLNKIMNLLWERKIKEIDFCEAIGINKSSVTDWKSGKTKSYEKHITKIADFFGVPEEYFDESENNTDKTNEFIELFSQLSEEQKKEVITQIKNVLSDK